jgi:LmbE family N-acetylglucosaminyl deacetylase
MMILCPHPDDEIIGCFSVLEDIKILDEMVSGVVFVDPLDNIRRKEAKKSAKTFTFIDYYLEGNFLELYDILDNSNPKIVFTPDLKDKHPLHKLTTRTILLLQKKYKYQIIYYSTDMNTDHLQELPRNNRHNKLKWLNEIYPSQKSLWEHEHKFFLFESYLTVPFNIRSPEEKR